MKSKTKNKIILPNFKKINLKNSYILIEKNINKFKKIIKSITDNDINYNWNNLCQIIEEYNNKISLIWSPISHLNNVNNNKETRKIYSKCLHIISQFNIWIIQNKKLYISYKNLKKNVTFKNLNTAQKMSVTNTIKNFELSGIHLPKTKKKYLANIKEKISKLQTKFNENILDSTNKWSKYIEDEKYIKGIPKNTLSFAKNLASLQNKKGWIFTLDDNIYVSIMKYAENRKLRKNIQYAYNTRASHKWPKNSTWNNDSIIKKILSLRHKLSKITGFKNYAEKSLSLKSAYSIKHVINFLNKIKKKAYKKSKKEIKELNKFAKINYGIKKIKQWDLMYLIEKLKKKKFLIYEEKIKSYFPEKTVIKGLFKIINKIYNLKIKRKKNINVWNKNVQFFQVYNKDKKIIGSLFLDLYSRKNKNSGAWMDDCITKLKYKNGYTQLPVAHIICNFNTPLKNQTSLLSHDEVITLFHEFGHAIHHISTKIDIASVSGINGVPWDIVEFPSQFMENFCWNKKSIKLISKHYKTKKSMPKYILNNLLLSKTFLSGMFLLKQIELSLFDIQIHSNFYFKKNKNVSSILNYIRKTTRLLKTPKWDKSINTFCHIFCGNYAAGYYSYLWADVISSEIFSKFTERGIFNKQTGLKLLNNILSIGGSKNILTSIKKFLGRKINTNSIEKKYGIN